MSITRYAATVVALIMAVTTGGCSSLSSLSEDSPIPVAVPTQRDVASMKPAGKVSLTEVYVDSVGVGKGILTFKGKSYPFKLAGTVMGPGSLTKRQVSGEVYKLEKLSDFPGIWVEGTGSVGLETSGSSELWLENKAGVIMHLVGKTEGITLSLGKDEVLIELSK